jgi:hypothetical protein
MKAQIKIPAKVGLFFFAEGQVYDVEEYGDTVHKGKRLQGAKLRVERNGEEFLVLVPIQNLELF